MELRLLASQEVALGGEGCASQEGSPRRPVLPDSSRAPATPLIKHKNILLALAQAVLGRQEGGIGPGEVWWPFQLVPQEVCKQAPEASGKQLSHQQSRKQVHRPARLGRASWLLGCESGKHGPGSLIPPLAAVSLGTESQR